MLYDKVLEISMLPMDLRLAKCWQIVFFMSIGKQPSIDFGGKTCMNHNRQEHAEQQANFEALYAKHSREVWAMAYARWMNADLASDIMQEAFMRLWKQWQNGEDILNPRAWLLRVARNLAEDYAKSAFRRNGTQAPQTMNGVRSKDAQPMELLEQEETFSQLREEMNPLSRQDREILTLRYAMDYNASEIAEVLGVNVTAVHMRLSRARQRLADRLQSNGVSPTS